MFPEAFLHGFGAIPNRSYKQNYEMALEIPGPETEALAEKAREHQIYIAGAAFERDSEYPDHFFNTGFIINDNGSVILKYRKHLVGHGIELSSTPADVLGTYGDDPAKLFPVIETPLGRLGLFICNDRRAPEIARSLAIQGAEVLLHPTGAGGGIAGIAERLDQWRTLTRVRAMENTCYLVGAQWAHSPRSELLTSVGHSLVISYTGAIISEVVGKEIDYVHASIDLESLRRHSAEAGLLFDIPAPIFERVYRDARLWPTNLEGVTAGAAMPQDIRERWDARRQAIRKRAEEGALLMPADTDGVVTFR